MNKHTPGPWAIVEAEYPTEDDVHFPIWDSAENTIIAYTRTCNETQNTQKDLDRLQADARLIAAAPEMLEALKQVLPLITDWAASSNNEEEASALQAIKSAIAQAEQE